jgi:DNA-binding IclR family transcriptional regulator
LVRIAHSVRFEIADIARPYLEDLSQRTGETVDLALLSGSKAVFVDQVQGSHRLRAVSAVGVSFPLASTANGKALLAALEPDALRKLKPQLHLNRTSWPKLEAELEEVRRNGVAYDRDQHSAGISAIGAAIAGPRGELAAISIPAPSSRFAENEAELTVALLECCSRLQEVLSTGGTGANR